MQPYTVTYNLTEQAYMAYNLYCLTSSASMRRLLLLGQFVPPFAVMLVCALLYFTSHLSATSACLASGVTYGVFVLFYPGRFRRGIKRRLGKIRDEGVGREFIGEHLMELRPTGIYDAGPNDYVVQVPYANVKRVVENEGHLYVFIGEATAFVIPLDALGGESGKAAFLAALVEKGAHISAA